MKSHIHKALTHKTYGFSTCVAPKNCNPKAHGGILHIDTCICGSIRWTNATSELNIESTGWTKRFSKPLGG